MSECVGVNVRAYAHTATCRHTQISTRTRHHTCTHSRTRACMFMHMHVRVCACVHALEVHALVMLCVYFVGACLRMCALARVSEFATCRGVSEAVESAATAVAFECGSMKQATGASIFKPLNVSAYKHLHEPTHVCTCLQARRAALLEQGEIVCAACAIVKCFERNDAEEVHLAGMGMQTSVWS